MREALREIEEERKTFSGIFVRFGFKNGWNRPVPTVLLKEIRNDNNEVVTDHLWFNLTKGFEKLDLQEGDIVQFDARVKSYVKGYFGHRYDVYKPRETDYKLSHPTKIQKISTAINIERESSCSEDNPDNNTLTESYGSWVEIAS
jgi:hypothetical protein